eukprot:TRINITY_DN4352_c0_g1_i1.p1 TRINITY_DN4352_c0_g1~~TRINITY_DN4352_c0_g1_i1.p1  ORF type:complete len:160 (-),score=1.28 TRINITY_DN4352_c0_g1_i1:15-494(-)
MTIHHRAGASLLSPPIPSPHPGHEPSVAMSPPVPNILHPFHASIPSAFVLHSSDSLPRVPDLLPHRAGHADVSVAVGCPDGPLIISCPCGRRLASSLLDRPTPPHFMTIPDPPLAMGVPARLQLLSQRSRGPWTHPPHPRRPRAPSHPIFTGTEPPMKR